MSEPRRFRKKPVVVEAMQSDCEVIAASRPPAVPANLRAFAPGVLSMRQVGSVTHGGPPQWLPAVRTLEGVMVVRPGDWIIRGVAGEFYPCKPDIFAATYEPVPPSQPAPRPPAEPMEPMVQFNPADFVSVNDESTRPTSPTEHP